MWLALLSGLCLPPLASGHLPQVALANVTVETNGHFSLNLTFDVPPFIFGVTPRQADDTVLNGWLDGSTNDLATGLASAQARFEKKFTVATDHGPGTIDTVIFPTVADMVRYRESPPTPRLPAMLMMAIEGHLPPGSDTVAFQFPPELGDVLGSINLPGQAPAAFAVNSDGSVAPIPLLLPGQTKVAHGLPAAVSLWPVVGQYLRLGFKHILPEGLDHILFVLGLFLLSCRLKPLLWQVTAFTLAHSITLGLALYGVIRLPSSVVEPLIALSIAFVAVENICTPKLQPWRPFVVFGFGLVHGLGFSSVLLSLGLPRPQFLPALLAFNSGVELGQFTVILAAFLCVGWWRERRWYRPAIIVPASALIAVTGIYWTVQRIEVVLH